MLTYPQQGELPLVGRHADLLSLEQAVRRRDDPHFLVVTGDRGVGKTRLVSDLAASLEAAGTRVLWARAFPLGSKSPYALLSDCFTPLLRDLDDSALQVLTRGTLPDLTHLFPAAVSAAAVAEPTHLTDDARARVFWSFVELLKGLADRQALLVCLDDIQWADGPSLELLHFSVRHTRGLGLNFLCTYEEGERAGNDILVETENSLVDLGLAARFSLAPLSPDQTLELLERTYRTGGGTLADFASRLYDWSLGNPGLIDALLRDLRDRGVLVKQGRQWRGWDASRVELPSSVAESSSARFDRLSASARVAAELMAIFGDDARLEDLEALDELDGRTLLNALDELRDRRLIRESQSEGGVSFAFTHPVLSEVLRSRVGLARRRDLHGRCGRVLLRRMGFTASAHPEVLAHHFAEADPATLGSEERGYLARAGRGALARMANQEAEKYLRAALRRSPSDDSLQGLEAAELLLDLGRAQHRLGKSDRAIARYHEALAQVPVDAEGAAITAAIRRRIGLIHLASLRYPQAMEQFEAGLQMATSESSLGARADLLIAQGRCLQDLGRLDEAERVMAEAESIADRLGDPQVQARVARSMVLLYAWTRPANFAREYGERALSLARKAKDPNSAFWAYWGLAVSAAMAGKAEPVRQHIDQARAIAEELGSPVLKASLSELAVELYYATGEWERGIALAEESLSLARSLVQTGLTVRLLVLASMFYLERGEVDRGRAYVGEAWTLAESAAMNRDTPAGFFMLIPAHVGKAACALWEGDYEEAVRLGEAGVALAEESGYKSWTIHRLLPIVAEGHIMLRNLDAAAAVGGKLRSESERLDHALGLAWASACDALLRWLGGDSENGAIQLREATEALEAIPMIPYAARVRRQLAGRLAETGNREAALQELRQVYDVFSRLGAEGELRKTREMFREVEARPPRRTAGAGVDGLTHREVEISRLVSEGLSNKAIGRTLGISHRTVSTHLSNVFKKVEVGSRAELADLARDRRL
ncbi:MAG: AAA family ATPase [Gemmatimonadota bacterium]|nr:AAA family ATPase [Gemmatimonadota bacterium]